jgi:hypothetical protein
VPSAWVVTSSAIWLDRLSIAWSRWSIRLEALLPVALALAIWALSDAIEAIEALAWSTSAERCWRTDTICELNTLFMLLKRWAIRLAAVTTCWRSGVEVGSTPATAFTAAKNWSMPLDRLALSSPMTCSSWVM